MKQRRLMNEINVVPYIDVMLVLLVIFMITTPLLSQGVKINLPQAQSQSIATQDNTPMIVSIDQYGRYYLNIANDPNKPIAPQDLAIRVAAEMQISNPQHQTRQVFIKGDKVVDYGKVVQAMVLLQQSGVSQVGLMTQPVG